MKKIFRNNHFVLSSLLLLCVTFSFGQNLDQIGKKGGIKVSGGLGVNQSLYFSDGIDERYNPYVYMINGNVNFDLYGFSVPLSFRYSNQKLTYGQPFNIVGLSPKYKNLTLHAGHRSMSFSSYTLAGHQFFGGGAEYSYKNFKIAAMGGRLLDPVEYVDSLNNKPVYSRLGSGVKMTYSKGGDEISIITFYGKDDENSIAALPDDVFIYPEENQVYSLSFKKKLADHVTFSFEGARSAWTKDQNSLNISEKAGLDNSIYALRVTQSTVFYNAFKSSLNFTLAKATLGLNIERVDPEYRTLGAYYFNSDFQNVTGSLSRDFFKKKMKVNANIGVQRDDLRNDKMSKMKRVVASVNSSITFSKKLSTTFGYSNFNSFVNVKPIDEAFVQNSIYERVDTMNFVQVNQTLMAGVNYKPLESSNVLHTLTLNGNYNTSSNENGGVQTATSMAGSNLAYHLNFKKTGVNLGFSGNANGNYYEEGTSSYFGAGLNASMKMLNKKVRASLNIRYSKNYEEGDLKANLYSISNSYSLNIKKKHSLNLNIRYSGREAITVSQFATYSSTFNELFITLGYNFRF